MSSWHPEVRGNICSLYLFITGKRAPRKSPYLLAPRWDHVFLNASTMSSPTALTGIIEACFMYTVAVTIQTISQKNPVNLIVQAQVTYS